MHEQELPLDYAVPAPVTRAKRPFWLDVTYLVLGAIVFGIGIMASFGRINLFSWVGHLERFAYIIACPALLLVGLIFMTKGLASFSTYPPNT